MGDGISITRILKWLFVIMLLSVVGSCGVIGYLVWEPCLPDVDYPIQIKADGSQYEFDYTPEWAISCKQTLSLSLKREDFNAWLSKRSHSLPKEESYPKFKLEVYHNGEKEYENIFLFYKYHSSTVKTPPVVPSTIRVIAYQGEPLVLIRYKPVGFGKYEDAYFEFEPHKRYKIVLTDLSTDPSLKDMTAFISLSRACDFRTVNFIQ